MGRDSRVLIVAIAVSISIHAPRVGRDQGRATIRPLMYFNPRAPCGARLRHMLREKAPRNFNPRAPCGARRPSAVPERVRRRFQSTRPVWGATWDQITDMAAAVFQSTRPVWGATTLSLAWRYMRKTFQSTRPVWGATIRPKRGHFFLGISIHAPRVGRDHSKFLQF